MNRRVLVLVAVIFPDTESCGLSVQLVIGLWVPPNDLEYELVDITESLEFLRGWVWLVDANAFLSPYAVCRHHSRARKNRSGGI